MGVFGNEYIIEGMTKDRGELVNQIAKFYEHVAKWTYKPQLQTVSWINSIRASSQAIRDTNSHPSLYKGFKIDENIDKINKRTINRLGAKNNIKSTELQKIYSEFPSVEDIINEDKLRKYLEKHQQNNKIEIKL